MLFIDRDSALSKFLENKNAPNFGVKRQIEPAYDVSVKSSNYDFMNNPGKDKAHQALISSIAVPFTSIFLHNLAVKFMKHKYFPTLRRQKSSELKSKKVGWCSTFPKHRGITFYENFRCKRA